MGSFSISAKDLGNDGIKYNVADRIAAIMIALCPLLQHYRAPIYNAAITCLVMVVLYVAFRVIILFRKIKWSRLKLVWPLIFYMIFRVVDHGTSFTELAQSGVIAVVLAAAAIGCLDVKCVCKTALCISLIATVGLAIQYICFYLFEFHLQMVPTSLFIPSAEQWILCAQTGLAGITGRRNSFYRPSAFFLEPSHVYVYAFPHLLLMLFGANGNKKKYIAAIVLTLGMILSTSGMGLAAVLGAWTIFFLLRNEEDGSFSLKNIFRKKNIIMLVALVVIFAILATTVTPIRKTVTRVFYTKTGVTAIGGRVTRAFETMEGLTLPQWIIGVEDTTHGISFNMPGLVAAVYRHGIIGMILSVLMFVKGIFTLSFPYMLFCAVYLVTSMFSAHTHSTVGLIYYGIIILMGYQTMDLRPSLLKKLKKQW